VIFARRTREIVGEASKRRAVPGGLQTFRGLRLLAVMFVYISQGCEFAS